MIQSCVVWICLWFVMFLLSGMSLWSLRPVLDLLIHGEFPPAGGRWKSFSALDKNIWGNWNNIYRNMLEYFPWGVCDEEFFWVKHEQLSFCSLCLQRPGSPPPGPGRSSPEPWPLSTRCTARGSLRFPLKLWAPRSAGRNSKPSSWRRWSGSPRSPTRPTGSAPACGCPTGRRRWCSSLGRDTTCRSTTWFWCRGAGPRTCPESNSLWFEENMTALTWWRRSSSWGSHCFHVFDYKWSIKTVWFQTSVDFAWNWTKINNERRVSATRIQT